MKKAKAELNTAIKSAIDQKLEVVDIQQVYIDGEHSYDYEKSKTDEGHSWHTLTYSDKSEWCNHVRKTVALQIIDDGNGIRIIGIDLTMDYLQAEELHILLRLSGGEDSLYQISEPPVKIEF